MAGVCYDEVMRWSVDDVIDWLEKNNLIEFRDFVNSNKIDGPDFLKLEKKRISHLKNISTGKRDALIRQVKELERGKPKLQKASKLVLGKPSGRPVPPVYTQPTPAVTRGVPPQPQYDDDDNDGGFDDEEWDDQGVYDNDEIVQPAKQRHDPPPPPPPNDDDDSDEDYVEPADPGPTCRPPAPPPPEDDDDEEGLYEKANPATIAAKNPPPRNPPARSVPLPPVQPPNITPPQRGGRAPVAPPHQQILYEESDAVSPPPPPRNASPPPPIPRPNAPTARTGPKRISFDAGVRGRAPVPAPQPEQDEYEETDQVLPQEIYEHPDEHEPLPSFPSRSLPQRPASPEEVYEDPPEPESVAVPDYESVEDMRRQMNRTPAGAQSRPPARVPPAAHVDEMYEMTDSLHRPPPPTQPSKGRGQRAPPPKPTQDPIVDDFYEQTDVNDDDVPPPKPEKLQLGKGARPGVPTVGIGLNTVAVREARGKLRTAIPKDFNEPTVVTTDKDPEAKGVGGIRNMFQAKAQPLTPQPAKVSKATPALPPTARSTAAAPPRPRSITENNAPGAPEPPKRRQERPPPPGPPGGPPETPNSAAVIPTPAADANDMKRQSWYFGDCERVKANKLLLDSREEGTYLVRDSKGSGQPYTLGIFYNGDVFNISIRQRPDGKFALGSEKPDEHVFETIYDMIRFHRNNAIEVSKSGILAGRVKLAKVAEK